MEYTIHLEVEILSESFGDALLAARELAEEIFDQDDVVGVNCHVEDEYPPDLDVLYSLGKHDSSEGGDENGFMD